MCVHAVRCMLCPLWQYQAQNPRVRFFPVQGFVLCDVVDELIQFCVCKQSVLMVMWDDTHFEHLPEV